MALRFEPSRFFLKGKVTQKQTSYKHKHTELMNYLSFDGWVSLHACTLYALWNDEQPSKLKDFFNVKSGFVFSKMT